MTVTNDLSRFAKRTTKAFNRMQTKRVFTYIGKIAVELIKDHTRKGYGVNKPGGRKRRLKGLSKNYKRYRERSGRRKLGRYAKPRLSNLNFTGKMIDSIKILTISKTRLTIGPAKRKHKGSKLTHWQIAQLHHYGRGALPVRKFNYLSRSEEKEVVEAFSEALTKELKNSRLLRRS